MDSKNLPKENKETQDPKEKTGYKAKTDSGKKPGLRNVFFSLIPALCAFLILASITGFFNEQNRAEERMNAAVQGNLTIQAESIDHSLFLLLSRAQNNLVRIAGTEDLARPLLEQEFLEEGSNRFKTVVNNSLEAQSTLFDRVIVRKEDQILYSTIKSDSLDYRIRGVSDANNYAVAQIGKENFYLALSTEPSENGLIYTGLIPVEALYEKMMVDSVNQNYWVVLYDGTGDLILQNEFYYPLCMVMDRETALSRGDGISYLVQADEKGICQTASYEYDIDRDGKADPILASFIPASLSENQAFAIGIHMDNSMFKALSTGSLTKSFLYSLLLVLSGTVLVVLFIRGRRKQAQTDKELEKLREKEELTEKLLANQTQLAHRQRMESLGVLTAGIAHEFNNLLTPILGHSLMAMQNIDDENSPLFTSAMETYSAAQKAKTLVARISSLTRKNPDNQLQELSVNGLVRSALELTQPSLPESVECIVELGAEHTLRCNEVMMHQCLMNLIINAYHAMKETGGTLTIRTMSDDKTVSIVVSDTGPGIPDEEKQKVFDPFYTTKAPGKGTGLGLPLAQSAVQNHGGTLTVSDTPGHGATFTAVFPLNFKGAEPRDNNSHIEPGTR